MHTARDLVLNLFCLMFCLGSTLVLWDLNRQGNEETAQMIREAGGKVQCYTVDVSKNETVKQAASQVS